MSAGQKMTDFICHYSIVKYFQSKKELPQGLDLSEVGVLDTYHELCSR